MLVFLAEGAWIFVVHSCWRLDKEEADEMRPRFFDDANLYRPVGSAVLEIQLVAGTIHLSEEGAGEDGVRTVDHSDEAGDERATCCLRLLQGRKTYARR